MIELAWSLAGVEPIPFGLAPQLELRLRAVAPPGVRVAGGFLRVQVRFQPLRRAYDPDEAERLVAVLGPRERWAEASRSLLWTVASLVLPAFEGETTVPLLLDCSHDATAAATRYFAALARGGAPLAFLFAGSVMHEGPQGELVVSPVPATCEAQGELPLATWAELIARHHPDGTWVRLPRPLVERLERWRATRALTPEAALAELLDAAEVRA